MTYAKTINSFVPDADGDPGFVPARPPILEKEPHILQILAAYRRDSISFWWKQAYLSPTMSVNILGRQVFIANSPASVKHVMVTRNDNFERKSPQMRRALEYLLGDGLFISDGETWALRRRMIAPIVHRNRLDIFTPIMVETVVEMAARWAEAGDGHEVDMLVEMGSLTAEIISRAVFGNNLGRQFALEVIAGFTEFQRLVDQLNPGYFLHFDEGWPVFKGPRMRRAIRRVHDVVDGIIAQHISGKGDNNSMIGMLLERADDVTGKKLSQKAIRNEALTIFMAGHETTAATLTWAWYLLSQAPWVEAKFHGEIDRVLGDGVPSMLNFRELSYTRAIFEETLRLYPPVPYLSRQARAADSITGRPIKAASLVLVIPWLLHRHRRYWQSPDGFHPERFLDGRRPEPYTYAPFAAGPRICTGAAFGLTEAVICLAVLGQKWRPRLNPDWTVKPACRLTLRPAGGLPMILEKR